MAGLLTVIAVAPSSCLTGVIANVIGSAIMRRAAYDGYDVATSAQNGAVGGAILFLVLCLSWVIFGAMQTDEPRSCGFGILHYLSGLSFTVGFAAACGAVGSAVLIATGHAVQQVTESAIAGAVGAATLAAGVMAFYLLLFPLLCCYWVDAVDERTTVSYTTTVEHPSYSRW